MCSLCRRCVCVRIVCYFRYGAGLMWGGVRARVGRVRGSACAYVCVRQCVRVCVRGDGRVLHLSSSPSLLPVSVPPSLPHMRDRVRALAPYNMTSPDYLRNNRSDPAQSSFLSGVFPGRQNRCDRGSQGCRYMFEKARERERARARGCLCQADALHFAACLPLGCKYGT